MATNYTAGSKGSFVLALTDSFGNTVLNASSVLTNGSTLQLLLTPSLGPSDPLAIPFSVDSASARGVAVSFTCNQTGRLEVTLALGGQQLLRGGISALLPGKNAA